MKKILTLSIVFVLFLSGCASQPNISESGPGFFVGLFHGFTLIFSLIGSLFSDIRIYEFPNKGFFYDLGFCLGISILYGGIHSSNKK